MRYDVYGCKSSSGFVILRFVRLMVLLDLRSFVFYICLINFQVMHYFKVGMLEYLCPVVLRNCDDGFCGIWTIIIRIWYSGCMIEMHGCVRKHIVPKPVEDWITYVVPSGRDTPPSDKPQIKEILDVWRLAAGNYH